MERRSRLALGGEGPPSCQGSSVAEDTSHSSGKTSVCPPRSRARVPGCVGGPHLVNRLPVVEQVGQGTNMASCGNRTATAVAHVPRVVQLVGRSTAGLITGPGSRDAFPRALLRVPPGGWSGEDPRCRRGGLPAGRQVVAKGAKGHWVKASRRRMQEAEGDGGSWRCFPRRYSSPLRQSVGEHHQFPRA